MKFKVFLAALIIFIGLNSNAIVPATQVAPAAKIEVYSYTPTKSLDIVANPNKYVNKRVQIKAKFDKFSTLGLDYSKAMRSSEKYIGFLIKRDDVTTHNIPLAQMKIFMKRTEAEKHIDLETGDEIEFDAIVFSSALNDSWLEVENFRVKKTKKELDKKIEKK